MWIVLIGPPGAGKGTQGRRLAKELGLGHLSTGDKLRSERGRELGEMVAKLINAGKLVPDDLVIELVKTQLTESEFDRGCVFDGFPRTVVQAEAIEEYLRATGGMNAVVHLDVDDDEVIDRLLKRAVSEGRADDTREGIAQRLEIFKKRTAPVLDFFQQREKVISVDGLQPPDDVFNAIRGALR